MKPLFPVQKAIGMRPVNKNYKVYLRVGARKINYLPSSKQCLFEVVPMEHRNGRSHTLTLFSWVCHHRQWHLWWRSYWAGEGNELVPYSWLEMCIFNEKNWSCLLFFCTGWLFQLFFPIFSTKMKNELQPTIATFADSAQTEYCNTFHCPCVRVSQAWHLTFLTYVRA